MAKPLVSSLSMAFKKATTINENVEEAKKEHRQTLKALMDRYTDDVSKGKAEGIRTAKELVEVIKLDLLLMGEATERTDNTSPVDEIQLTKLTQALDENSPEVQALMDSLFGALNDANDNMDNNPSTITKTTTTPVEGDGDNGVSIPESDESVSKSE